MRPASPPSPSKRYGGRRSASKRTFKSQVRRVIKHYRDGPLPVSYRVVKAKMSAHRSYRRG